MASRPHLRSDPEQIGRTLGVLFQEGDVVEMRIPKTERDGTVSGYFTDYGALAKQLAARNGDAAVYVTLNPVTPALLARCANRVRSRARTTTSDHDIQRRRWLLVDCDPVRPADISSNDVEHEAALERARDIRMVLSEEGWPAPVLADSGNGAHLLYRIDLPNDEVSAALVEGVLKSLAARFNDAAVKVDETVFNAARIVKAYGTVTRKGDDVHERPDRLSRIMEAPTRLESVPREVLEEWAHPPAVNPPRQSRRKTAAFDIDAFVGRHLLAASPVAHEGGRKWVLEECPFNPDHKAPDSAIFEHADGSLGFKCFHNSCSAKTWKDVRERFEGHRSERRAGASSVGQAAPPQILSYSELKMVKRPVTEMLFEDYPLPASGATLMFGQSRAGKTILAVQQALAVARGKALFDYYRVRKPGAVLVVEQDDPAGSASVGHLVEPSGGGPEDMPFHTVEKLPFSFGPAFLNWLENEITNRKLVMVVLDSYTALRGPRGAGIDIVKAEQMDLSQLDALGKRLECAIVIIHHDSTGKAQRNLDWNQTAAGTFAMGMATEAQIHVARFADLDIKASERLVRMRPRHGTDVHLVLRFREQTEDYEHVLESSAAAWYTVMRQIRAEFGKEAFSPKALTQIAGVTAATAHRWLDRLQIAGAVQRQGRGEYVLMANV
jgi:hypothetical protein